MLIKFNHGRWLNLELENIKAISTSHAIINGKKSAKFVVDVETFDNSETSNFFDTFEDAEKFAQDIVDRLNGGN